MGENLHSFQEEQRKERKQMCLICIKICICNRRVKFSICGFRNWWEQATRCTVLLPLCIYVHESVNSHVCALFAIFSLLSMHRHRFYAGKYMYKPTSSFHFQSSTPTENLVFNSYVTYFLEILSLLIAI